jgi:hypothetical protein
MAQHENDPAAHSPGASEASDAERRAAEAVHPGEAEGAAEQASRAPPTEPPAVPPPPRPRGRRSGLRLTLVAATIGLLATAAAIGAYRFRDRHEKLETFATLVDKAFARPETLVAALRETSLKWLGDAARPTRKAPPEQEPPAEPKSPEQKSAEQQSSEPKFAEPTLAEPSSEATRSEATRSEATRSEAMRSEATRSEATRSEAMSAEAMSAEAMRAEAEKPAESPPAAAEIPKESGVAAVEPAEPAIAAAEPPPQPSNLPLPPSRAEALAPPRVEIAEPERRPAPRETIAESPTSPAPPPSRADEKEKLAHDAAHAAGSAAPGESAGPALKDVQDNVAGLEGRIDEIGDEVKALREKLARLDEIADELKALREKLEAPKDETRLPREAAEQAAAAAEPKGPDHAAVVVLAHSLHRALERGAPFASEYAALAASGADPQALAALAGVADAGAPTARQLRASFHPYARQIEAMTEPKSDAPIGDRLLHGVGKLVKVRPTGESASADVADLAADIEKALEHDDVGKALDAFARLPEEARTAARDWEETARRRLDAEKAAASILSGAIAALGKSKS